MLDEQGETVDIALADLNAEIVDDASHEGVQILNFDYRGFEYFVPFSKLPAHYTRTDMNIWKHDGGSTIKDLTLSPSYWVKAPEEEEIHVHVRSGVVTGLPGPDIPVAS